MYQSASSKPKSSESSLKLRQFYNSIHYMHPISECAFTWKINGPDFLNGRNVGHCPQVFIQIQNNEELKAHTPKARRPGKEQNMQAKLLIGCLAGPRGAGSLQAQFSSDNACSSYCHRASFHPGGLRPSRSLTLSQSCGQESRRKGRRTSERSQGSELKSNKKPNVRRRDRFGDIARVR